MTEMPSGVQGAEQLIEVFGFWPSFHDAEVLLLSLDREGSAAAPGPNAECVIHVFHMTSEVSPEGHYVLKNHTLVTFRFLEVVQLELCGFNFQNVLWGLYITDISERQLERVCFDVSLPASFGLEATFQCYAIEVTRVQPCDSEGKVLVTAG